MEDGAENLPQPVDLWKNRRQMAWISFVVALLYPFMGLALVMEDDELKEVVIDLAPTFYTFLGAVVTVYIGAATVEDTWGRK